MAGKGRLPDLVGLITLISPVLPAFYYSRAPSSGSGWFSPNATLLTLRLHICLAALGDGRARAPRLHDAYPPTLPPLLHARRTRRATFPLPARWDDGTKTEEEETSKTPRTFRERGEKAASNAHNARRRHFCLRPYPLAFTQQLCPACTGLPHTCPVFREQTCAVVSLPTAHAAISFPSPAPAYTQTR